MNESVTGLCVTHTKTRNETIYRKKRDAKIHTNEKEIVCVGTIRQFCNEIIVLNLILICGAAFFLYV